MNKPELISWLQAEYRQWEAFLEQIGPERMEQPGVTGNWSIKDIVAHLTGWNRWLVARLNAARDDEPQPSPRWPASLQNDDEINAWIYENSRDQSLQDVLAESRQVFQQLVATVERFPDDLTIDPSYRIVRFGDQRFSVSEFFDHFHDDHEPDMRAWLSRGTQAG